MVFPCNECDKKFTRYTALEMHIDHAHTGVLFHTCHYCGKGSSYDTKVWYMGMVHIICTCITRDAPELAPAPVPRVPEPEPGVTGAK